jgi:hypothetical protein
VTSNRKLIFEVAAPSLENGEESVEIAVNGTLMRGLELEPNLLNLGATFVREDQTEKAYRLFSINDVHPGMVRLPAKGFEEKAAVSVVVEIWRVPVSGVVTLLEKEPPGLSIGKVKLNDGETEVLGVLAEPSLVAGKRDISDFPGNGKANFRDYVVQEGMKIIDRALKINADLNEDQLAVVRSYRNTAELLYRHGQLRRAVDVLNHDIKMLGLKDRLFLNIPLAN